MTTKDLGADAVGAKATAGHVDASVRKTAPARITPNTLIGRLHDLAAAIESRAMTPETAASCVRRIADDMADPMLWIRGETGGSKLR